MKITVAKPKDPGDRRTPDQVIGEVSEASRRGSTYHKRLRLCPREHALSTLVRLRSTRDTEALTVGYLYHRGLEHYYRFWQQNPGCRDVEKEDCAFQAIAPFATEPGYADTYAVVERLLIGYFQQYRTYDRWEILAVEETLEHNRPVLYTARLDLVIHDLDQGRVFVVEHKSARAISLPLIESYEMDLQILGQAWLFKHCVDAARLPAPFGGIRVRIGSKTATPKFIEVPTLPSENHLRAFENQLRAWARLEDTYRELGWPQDFSKCAGVSRGFSKCQYYGVCHGAPEMTVKQLLDLDAPPGFVKSDT